MLLAIDAGNTNICFAVYEGDTKVNQWRVKTNEFDEIPSFEGMVIDDVIVCSVVPSVNDALSQRCLEKFNVEPTFITHENIDIKINIDNPAQLGTDRMVGASAAVAHYQTPAVIVDFGTSTNFDVIDETGTHCGGVLTTGARLSLKALSDAAAQLPEIEIEEPQSVIGKNTQDAMQSGIYHGYIGLAEGIVARITKEMGVKPFIIGTGGLAPLFERGTDIFDIIDQDLIMKGLVHMHRVIKS